SDSFASGMRTREFELLLKTGVVLSEYPFDVAVPTTDVSCPARPASAPPVAPKVSAIRATIIAGDGLLSRSLLIASSPLGNAAGDCNTPPVQRNTPDHRERWSSRSLHREAIGATCEGPGSSRADDGTRTRYLELGKLALYQVSYVR